MATSLLDDYQYIAKHIAIKNTLYTKRDKPSLLSNLLYYICLFIVVVVLAGVLTGFGQAAPIISAIVSLFPFVNIQVGYFALLAFSIYAIPWAMVYIPDVSNIFRHWWENWQDYLSGRASIPNRNSIALDRAHNILSMLYRKEMKREGVRSNTQLYTSMLKKDALTHVGNTLIYLSILDALEEKIYLEWENIDDFYSNVAKRDSFKLGYHLIKKAKYSEGNNFKNLLEETAEIHLSHDANLLSESEAFLNDQIQNHQSGRKKHFFWSILSKQIVTGLNNFDMQSWVKFRKELLNTQTASAYQATQNKQIAQRIWDIQRKHVSTISRWSLTAEWLGTVLGFLNASIANASGTALAPLYLISTIFMIYGIPNAVISFALAYNLVIAFAASGFVSSFGITRKSIEKSFSNMANFILDNDRAQRSHKKFVYHGPIYKKPFAYLYHINKRYSILPILMALFLSLAIASFNFLAGVTCAHMILNPSIMIHPTQIAAFSIQSLSSLTAFELGLGIIGFSFTVIAVTPLMLCAWKSFLKSIKLEPLSTKPWLTLAAFLTSLINTMLMFRMMLRPGSPLDLFFGASPLVIKIMTYVAPICILILGFALFYMGLKTMLSDKGRNVISICKESLALKANYHTPKLIPASKINQQNKERNNFIINNLPTLLILSNNDNRFVM